MSENTDLIELASATLNPHRVGDRLFGDVAAALQTTTGAIHSGVCIDTGSGTGFCAEHAAIASMVTSGEYAIARIVAVWKDAEGRLTVLAPCGRCREFMRQMDPSNIETTVVLSHGRTARLRDLIPEWEWPEPEPPVRAWLPQASDPLSAQTRRAGNSTKSTSSSTAAASSDR